jgi:hypothetical protein
MKTIKMTAVLALGLTGLLCFGSCKKNYTCTCTTIVGPVSTTNTHGIDNALYNDAKRTCRDYEDQANKALPGSTTCRL